MDKSRLVVDTYNKIAYIYTNKYFSDLTDTSYIDKFLNQLPKRGNVLDVGCGPGTFSKYLVQKGFVVAGVDLSEEMIKIAKNKVKEATFKVMDMRRLDFDKGFFDGLLIAYSLIHIPSTEIAHTLKGFKKVLKTGGLIMLIAQSGEPDKIVDEPLLKGEQIFINFFTQQRLSDFLTDSGLEVTYQEEVSMTDADSLSDSVIYTIAKKQ